MFTHQGTLTRAHVCVCENVEPFCRAAGMINLEALTLTKVSGFDPNPHL